VLSWQAVGSEDWREPYNIHSQEDYTSNHAKKLKRMEQYEQARLGDRSGTIDGTRLMKAHSLLGVLRSICRGRSEAEVCECPPRASPHRGGPWLYIERNDVISGRLLIGLALERCRDAVRRDASRSS
jgi:hypothetical protein